MSRATRPLLCLAALAAVAAGLAAQPPETAPRPAREEPFAETIDVVETSAVVELPGGRDDAGPTDLLLLEAGMPREIVRVEPLSAEPWELVLWVDGPLCDPAAHEATLVALAQQAEALTGLGEVRVVVAAPEPRTVVAPTREPRLLAERLAALAREAPCSGRPNALLWEARAANSAAAGEHALAALRELVDDRHGRLAAAAEPCTAAACALLLVAHGYPPHADLALPLAMRPRSAAEQGAALEAAAAELGRRLAVARWAVVALPFAPPVSEEAGDEVPAGARPGPGSGPTPLLEDAGYPVFRVWPRRGATASRALPAAAWDVYTIPDLAPLRELADLTSGLVLRAPDQLPAALEVLAARVRVWYRTAPFAPGETRPLEVLVGAPLRRAAAPAWVGAPARSGAP